MHHLTVSFLFFFTTGRSVTFSDFFSTDFRSLLASESNIEGGISSKLWIFNPLLTAKTHAVVRPAKTDALLDRPRICNGTQMPKDGMNA